MAKFSELYNYIISDARGKYGEIVPCGEKTDLHECFTFEPELGLLIFWFLCVGNKSTHTLMYRVTAETWGAKND